VVAWKNAAAGLKKDGFGHMSTGGGGELRLQSWR